MRIEDAFTVDLPRERVWSLITDPATVAACMPGCQGVEVLSPTRYKARIVVGIGPIKAQFALDIDITAMAEPSRMTTIARGEEGSRASMVTAESELVLETLADGGTEVRYAADIQVVGRLGKFGLGIMKKKAKSLGDEFADAFRARAAA